MINTVGSLILVICVKEILNRYWLYSLQTQDDLSQKRCWFCCTPIKRKHSYLPGCSLREWLSVNISVLPPWGRRYGDVDPSPEMCCLSLAYLSWAHSQFQGAPQFENVAHSKPLIFSVSRLLQFELRPQVVR